MVFDIQGKRKGVVKVVYAILALLMGASLFLVTGAGSIGDLFGGNGGTTSAARAFEDQAAKIEQKLKKQPEDEALLASLFRTRVNAANAGIVVDPRTQQQEIPSEAITQFQRAGDAWDEYLEQVGKEASPSLAQLAANAFFTATANTNIGPQTLRDLKAASEAQVIVAKAKPTLSSLSTLAFYQYFALEFDAAEKSKKRAEELTTSKAQVKALNEQLDEVLKNAKRFQKTQKELELAQTAQGGGKEALENPLGGIGGSSMTAPGG